MARTRAVNISESLAQDIRENLMVLASIDGVDGVLYGRQIAYYREVAAFLGCAADVERLIAAVSAEAQAQQPRANDPRDWLAG